MNILDISKQHTRYYSAATQPEIVEIGKLNYLSILGSGSPGATVFYDKKKAIQDFAYHLQGQFAGTDKAFKSDIIEIFYWFDEKDGMTDIGNFYTTIDLNLLQYRIAILIPDFIIEEDIMMAAEKIKGNPFANLVELFSYAAGKCVQMMHLGPFAGELESLPILQNFVTKNGLRKAGMHQEIHISPFEKGQSQANLKTILRDPVQPI